MISLVTVLAGCQHTVARWASPDSTGGAFLGVLITEQREDAPDIGNLNTLQCELKGIEAARGSRVRRWRWNTGASLIGKAEFEGRAGRIHKKFRKDSARLHDYLRVRPVPVVVRRKTFYLFDLTIP